ncbi:MAG: DUF4340 domain-containing protein [bacterium]|nr:DUF4340 domain-containing protein [bacterium]
MIFSNGVDRSGGAGRTAMILVLALVVAGTALFFINRRHNAENLTLGGSLFDLEKSAIEGFLLTRDGAQFRFDKNEKGYWTLRGAITDFLDPSAVESFLNDLVAAQGGRVLPGTEIEDRRYEFNGPQAMRLTVFQTGKENQSLALGSVNPVTGFYYASGAGRPACFPLKPSFQEKLAALPASLQLQTLLPRFERNLISQVDVKYYLESLQLKKINGRWWLAEPKNGTAGLGIKARSYHQQYLDRRLQNEGQFWLLANEEAVRQLIYETSEIIVNDIPDTRWGRSRLEELDLNPPWRTVLLTGSGINPDFAEDSADHLEIALGAPLSDQLVPVLRRGNVLMTEPEAARRLNEPLGGFLQVGALSFQLDSANSMRAFREDDLVFAGKRGPAPEIRPGQRPRPAVESWLTTVPAQEKVTGLSDIGYHGIVQYLITDLQRLQVLRVLPPVKNADILMPQERVVLEFEFDSDSDEIEHYTGKGTERIEFGYLNDEHLPLGSMAPKPGEGSSLPVVMWRPQTGQLLQVQDHILITMRNRQTGLGK